MLSKELSLRFMSDKLQFVVCCETSFHRRIDKLKFIGHLLMILGLSSGFAQAQVTPDLQKLESGKSIESKVAENRTTEHVIPKPALPHYPTTAISEPIDHASGFSLCPCF